MKVEICMPKMRPEMERGVFCAWLKEEGDSVVKGEPIFEIETEKVVSQVEAEADGVLRQLLAEEGDEIPVDQVIGLMETEL